MRLRTRIFGQLVIAACIPTLIAGTVAWVLLDRAVEQTTRQLTPEAPELTLNSMRLLEDRLRQTAHDAIMESISLRTIRADSALDFFIVRRGDGLVHSTFKVPLSALADSILAGDAAPPGFFRTVMHRRLLLGFCVDTQGMRFSGGYVLDPEYLSGLQSAAEQLSQSRGFHNQLPGLMSFLLAAMVLLLAVIIISALIMSNQLAKSVTSPLERLSAAATLFSRGERPELAHLGRSDEIRVLEDSFRRLLHDLDNNRARLIASERIAAWQEFARRLAHELKNPLTPISLSLYRLEEKLRKDDRLENVAEPLEAMRAEFEHLKRLADDYGTLAHLPAPRFIQFDFNQVAREVVSLFAPQLESFVCADQLSDGPLTAEGDPDRLREVMVNILKNAVAFTPVGREINMTSGASNDLVFFAVTNDNQDSGVTEETLRQAARPYFSTRPGGTGIGLAIAEKIVVDHGGRLTLSLLGARTEARFDIPRHHSEETAV